MCVWYVYMIIRLLAPTHITAPTCHEPYIDDVFQKGARVMIFTRMVIFRLPLDIRLAYLTCAEGYLHVKEES